MVIAILAGGTASRFGGGKLQAELGGLPLASHSIGMALSHGLPVGIVTHKGSPHNWAASYPDCSIIDNHEAANGIGTSIKAAAAWARSIQAKALVLLLADMPFVPARLVRELIDAAESGLRAGCRYHDGAIGIPAAFPEAEFDSLLEIKDGEGAKNLLSPTSTLILRPPQTALLDIDTKNDLAHANSLLDRSVPKIRLAMSY